MTFCGRPNKDDNGANLSKVHHPGDQHTWEKVQKVILLFPDLLVVLGKILIENVDAKHADYNSN